MLYVLSIAFSLLGLGYDMQSLIIEGKPGVYFVENLTHSYSQQKILSAVSEELNSSKNCLILEILHLLDQKTQKQ